MCVRGGTVSNSGRPPCRPLGPLLPQTSTCQGHASTTALAGPRPFLPGLELRSEPWLSSPILMVREACSLVGVELCYILLLTGHGGCSQTPSLPGQGSSPLISGASSWALVEHYRSLGPFLPHFIPFSPTPLLVTLSSSLTTLFTGDPRR